MGAQYKPVKGDRVRVVLEGEVGWVSGSGTGNFEVGMGDSYVNPGRAEVISVEKIEPPVDIFKPGDVVRSIGGNLYALTEDGYVDLKSGKVWNDGRSWCENTFTSRYYEKVSLG